MIAGAELSPNECQSGWCCFTCSVSHSDETGEYDEAHVLPKRSCTVVKRRFHLLCFTMMDIQRNLSIADTFGTTENVPINEVSSFQGHYCTQLYLAETLDSILIEEVSSFQGCPFREVPCTHCSRFESLCTLRSCMC